MTFSVAKSYLAVLAGVAVRDGLIRSIDDPVRDYALDSDFEPEQNRSITWRHFLNQTSEWEGTLFSKPDLVDRNRRTFFVGDRSVESGFLLDLGRERTVDALVLLPLHLEGDSLPEQYVIEIGRAHV